MAGVDFARLRNQTMADGQDSEVTVNTRALIDKVLARYSSEHTTLRELIQNASDAGASSVVIRYDTDPSLDIPAPQNSDKASFLKHIIQNHTLRRLVVTNNGQPFTPADWSRLKSIADGNPDETKIGAFGVGFYSVFADCDEPFVVSGDKTMAFYWKGNTLSTKVASVPVEQRTSNTAFSLDYRQANPASPSYSPSKIPNLPDLCQFLATSLTFVGLQTIELHLDEHKVAVLTRKISPPVEVGFPPGLKSDTEGGFMRVKTLTRQHSQIDAEWSNVIATAQLPPKRTAELVQAEMRNAGTTLKSFFSKFSAPSTQASAKVQKPLSTSDKTLIGSDDIAGDSRGVLFLQVITVEAETHVSRKFAAEIERATKKPPPRKTRIALLTSPFQESSARLITGSGTTEHLATRIFAEVLPNKEGRIFIGFPTAQTTGYLAHVSAPSLIPTVERENVDMNARYISTWNIELLRIAGLACRISYASDMGDILYKAKTEPIASLIPRTIYLFEQFTAKASHPSKSLGEKIDEAFWNCSKDRSIAILSSQGVLPSKIVRMPAETLSFLGEVPMVPQELATGAVQFMLCLHNRGFISEITMADIRRGLESRALNEEELVEFLKWCGAKLETGELDADGVRSLFDITVANIAVTSEEDAGKILPLGDISSYVNSARINPTLPIPPYTIPFAFSKTIPLKQLQMFGWTELSMVQWLRFLTSKPTLHEFSTTEGVALQVLTLASRSWDQLDNSSKEAVVTLLKPHTIMPTKMGMRRPEESYFPTVKLFEDLPTIKPFPGSKDKFLVALGVRKTVDLPMVFDRMKTQEPAEKGGSVPWNHADLIRYFASVMDEIPKKDLDRLRQTPFLPGEGSNVKQGQLFRAQELYVPDPVLLTLGLTQVRLPYEWRQNSREATFLLQLGLRQWPNIMTVANILHNAGKSNNKQSYDLALAYFLQNHYRNGYMKEMQQIANSTLAIVPTEQAPFPNLVAPFQCFINEQATCFDYPVLRADLRQHAEKFGIQRDPDIKLCVQKLLKQPPRSKIDAEMQFAYLASRSSELDKHQSLITQLSTTNIVPITRKYYLEPGSVGFEGTTNRQTGKSELRIHHYDPPETVFVGNDEEWGGILDYVHFGAEATAFLLKIGAKHEPSSHDLATLVSKSPARFLNTIGQERYLELLRKLADNAVNLWKDKELVKTLIASRVLLGYRDIKEGGKKQPPIEDDTLDDFEEPDVHREWSLNKANEVVIIDDVQFLTMFRDFIIAAPQEEALEEFYARFGVRKISELIKSDRRIGVVVRDQVPAQKLRKDILERTRLFLHEYERDASSKSIRHDAKWLSSNLVVEMVSDIRIQFSLSDRNVATSSTRTAALSRVRSKGIVLNITPKYDVFEVAAELVRVLIQRPKQNDTIALERILTEPLRRLQAKGINVERILRRKEYEARIAKQQELQREQEEQQRLAQEASERAITKTRRSEEDHAEKAEKPQVPATPERSHNMPGAFGSPEVDTTEHNRSTSEKGLLGTWAKKLGFKNAPTDGGGHEGQGPPTERDIQATKSTMRNAIKDCHPVNMNNINTAHHQDPTELDRGGYCNQEQYENLHKAFSIPYNGRHVDIYYGRKHSETPQDISNPLFTFLPVIFGLTTVFGVDPGSVYVFLDSSSHALAFNMSGSLFFNLAFFIKLHAANYNTMPGRQKALDSWFLTYTHELAHNVVKDHNARHNWYQQQFAIEFSQDYRRKLLDFCKELQGNGQGQGRVEEVD